LIWNGGAPGASVDYVGDDAVVNLPPLCETVRP
jgi:hypothetical protein